MCQITPISKHNPHNASNGELILPSCGLADLLSVYEVRWALL
jgi:hypothetical protein